MTASRSSFRQRIRIAILLPSALAVGLSVVVFVALQWRRSLADNEERLRTLGLVFAENCASSLAFDSPDDAQKLLATLHSEQAVREAVLFDKAGRTFASYRTAAPPSPLQIAPGTARVLREAGRLVLQQSVDEGGRHFGTLVLRWDLRPLFAEMRTYAIGALLIALACVVAAYLMGDLLHRSVTAPVLQLAQTAEVIARDQNLAVRAPIPPIEELATLANAFNAMLARVAQEIDATRRAERELRLITDATPGLIAYVGRDLRYGFVNQTYQRWFGRTESELVGHSLEEVLGAAAFERILPYMERALAGSRVEFETEAPYRDGGSRWIQAHYLPNTAPDGPVLGVFVLVIDITERKRMERSLAKAHAELEAHSQTLERTVEERTARMREVIGELEAFSYSIAHDMRAPLRGMQGFSRLLLEEHAPQLNDEGRSYLQRIIASADRLDRLIQDVLNYSRVVREDLRLEAVAAQRLIEEIVATYPEFQAPKADIQVEGAIPSLWANPAALTQVVSNLLGNAVKFVAKGVKPVVRVRADVRGSPGTPDHWVRVTVSDNGIGIPRESQGRLFAMFQRLHRPELYQGTGMGLAIVRKAVERMGGRLGVESSPGQGSQFWFELRAEEPK